MQAPALCGKDPRFRDYHKPVDKYRLHFRFGFGSIVGAAEKADRGGESHRAHGTQPRRPIIQVATGGWESTPWQGCFSFIGCFRS